MDALGFIDAGGSGFGFEHGPTFVRLRAGVITDPYSGKPIGEDWDNPTEWEIPSAHLASQSSFIGSAPVREAMTTNDQLIIDDPTADVKVGDRIRSGDQTWSVTGRPTDDTNPWSGWQPTLVVNLEEPTG